MEKWNIGKMIQLYPINPTQINKQIKKFESTTKINLKTHNYDSKK